LTARGDTVDVDRYRHDQARSTGVPVARRSSVAVEQHARLDALPLGPAVLEPDLDLDLAEAQLARDRRALGERQVLLAGELSFELHQLVAAERRPSPPPSPVMLAALTAATFPGRRGRLSVLDVVVVVGVGGVGVSGRPVTRRRSDDYVLLLAGDDAFTVRHRRYFTLHATPGITVST